MKFQLSLLGLSLLVASAGLGACATEEVDAGDETGGRVGSGGARNVTGGAGGTGGSGASSAGGTGGSTAGAGGGAGEAGSAGAGGAAGSAGAGGTAGAGGSAGAAGSAGSGGTAGATCTGGEAPVTTPLDCASQSFAGVSCGAEANYPEFYCDYASRNLRDETAVATFNCLVAIPGTDPCDAAFVTAADACFYGSAANACEAPPLMMEDGSDFGCPELIADEFCTDTTLTVDTCEQIYDALPSAKALEVFNCYLDNCNVPDFATDEDAFNDCLTNL